MDFTFIEDETVRTKAEADYNSEMKLVTDGIDAKIEEAVKPLKDKNIELLDEKKKIAETLKNFDNIDPDAARDALNFLDTNEEAQMIKDGKIEDVILKRTSTLTSDHEAALLELNTTLKEVSANGNTFQTLYESKMIDDSLRDAALKSKVRPEALSDILLRGGSVFTLAKDSSVEARDVDGKLRKTEDDKVLTPTNWIESLKKVAPHYWPSSAGIDARGESDMSDLDAAITKAAEAGNQKEYRRLKAKKRKG